MFLHFQWTILNIAVYRNIHPIAMYRDIIVLWPMYHDANRIMTFLPIPSPGVYSVERISSTAVVSSMNLSWMRKKFKFQFRILKMSFISIILPSAVEVSEQKTNWMARATCENLLGSLLVSEVAILFCFNRLMKPFESRTLRNRLFEVRPKQTDCSTK